MKLILTFNGSSFDIPRILNTFHIPNLDCAHIDLRWIAYHKGLRGGLKQISRQLGIRRPFDIETLSGDEAIYLWDDWSRMGDKDALSLLKRYCAADVLLLYLLAAELLKADGVVIDQLIPQNEIWQQLPAS